MSLSLYMIENDFSRPYPFDLVFENEYWWNKKIHA